MLFDDEDDLELVGDTALTSVQVEWILLENRMVKKYYFERTKGVWMLEAINLRQIEQGENEDFVAFYLRFVTDSVYQSRHIREPLEYITIDPDDEFSILETTLDLNQWYAFRPVLPVDRLSNINYGQRIAITLIRNPESKWDWKRIYQYFLFSQTSWRVGVI